MEGDLKQQAKNLFGKPRVTKPETRREKIERRMFCGVEFYITIGSTFALLPQFTFDYSRVLATEIAFDWLWLHIGVLIR